MLRQRPTGTAASSSQSHNYYGGYGGGGGGNNNGYGGYTDGYNQNQNSNHRYPGQSSTSSMSDNKYSKKSHRYNANLMVYIGLGVMFVWTCTSLYFWRTAKSNYNTILKAVGVSTSNEVLTYVKELQESIIQQGQTKDNIRQEILVKSKEMDLLQSQKNTLQKERDELRVKYEGPDKKEEEERLLMRDSAFRDQLQLLKQATRKESKRSVIERFGPGPHEVQMWFKVGEGDVYDFVIEMAPLDVVPHAIHLFLEQVDHGLWTGSFFYLNGPHVLQAGPQLIVNDEEEEEGDDDDDYDRKRRLKFAQVGLDRLAFPDYSDEFPHKTWTLGFTGRPGGPDFYVNKMDNTIGHGPGGQPHVLSEEGDACFGKVSKGKENLSKLFRQPTYADKSEYHYFFVTPIEIVNSTILTKNPVLANTVKSTKTTTASTTKVTKVINDTDPAATSGDTQAKGDAAGTGATSSKSDAADKNSSVNDSTDPAAKTGDGQTKVDDGDTLETSTKSDAADTKEPDSDKDEKVDEGKSNGDSDKAVNSTNSVEADKKDTDTSATSSATVTTDGVQEAAITTDGGGATLQFTLKAKSSDTKDSVQQKGTADGDQNKSEPTSKVEADKGSSKQAKKIKRKPRLPKIDHQVEP